jgi:hypothetical protein
MYNEKAPQPAGPSQYLTPLEISGGGGADYDSGGSHAVCNGDDECRTGADSASCA